MSFLKNRVGTIGFYKNIGLNIVFSKNKGGDCGINPICSDEINS